MSPTRLTVRSADRNDGSLHAGGYRVSPERAVTTRGSCRRGRGHPHTVTGPTRAMLQNDLRSGDTDRRDQRTDRLVSDRALWDAVDAVGVRGEGRRVCAARRTTKYGLRVVPQQPEAAPSRIASPRLRGIEVDVVRSSRDDDPCSLARERSVLTLSR